MRTGIGSKLERFASEPRGQILLVVFVLALSLVVRLLVAWRTHGCDIDQGCFSAWFSHAASGGLSSFYDTTWCDYPPFNVYIFWLFGKLASALGSDSLPFITKLPGNLFDIATALLIFSFLRPRFSFKVALGVMALYAFNPATIFDLAVWGQMDSVYTFFMIASLYSVFRSKYELSGGLMSLAILTKPQSVVLLPVLAYIILRNGGLNRAITSSAAFLAVALVVIIPFSWDSPIAFMIDRYAGYNVYPYTSVNAYSLWALAGFWENDTVVHLGLTYQQWGILAFVAFAAFVMWQLHRRYDTRSAVFAVFLLAFGFFMLMTRMHERYLFSVFALLALGWYTRFTIWIYLGLTATVFAQLAYALSLLNSEAYWIADGHWSVYVLVPANIILFGLSIWTFWRMQHRRLPRAAPVPPPPDEMRDVTAEQPPPREEEA